MFIMKRIILIISVLASLFVTGCKKSTLPQIILISDKYEVQVTNYNNNVVFTLSWEQKGGNTDITQTYVQFSNDKEFVSPYVLKSSGNSFVVTGKDLKKIQDTFGVLKDYELIIRLLVEGEGAPSVYSNKVRIQVGIEK